MPHILFKKAKFGYNNLMIKSTGNIESVKRAIGLLAEKRVKVTQNLGRNKMASYVGEVTGVYGALFTVRPESPYLGKTSFSYSEILMGSVMIKKL